MEGTLSIEGLTKRYGKLVAVDQLSLTIPKGVVYGILGPNGAGKTTTLEMVEGLRTPDAGTVTLDGVDLVRRPDEARRRLGVQLQTSAFFDLLTVGETLQMFGRFYPKALSAAALGRRLGLEEKMDARVGTLSGGQRQRLAIAVALVHDPTVVFLDEPSAGLDPQARRHLWDIVRSLKDEGRTVVLTTHSMEEAEAICDALAIMDRGRVLDEGSPGALIAKHVPGAVIEVDAAVPVPDDVDLPAMRGLQKDHAVTRIGTERLEETLVGLVEWAKRRGIALTGLRTRGGSLEDVFLKLTGRSLRE